MFEIRTQREKINLYVNSFICARLFLTLYLCRICIFHLSIRISNASMKIIGIVNKQPKLDPNTTCREDRHREKEASGNSLATTKHGCTS
jgi:hypothetical protein